MRTLINRIQLCLRILNLLAALANGFCHHPVHVSLRLDRLIVSYISHVHCINRLARILRQKIVSRATYFSGTCTGVL